MTERLTMDTQALENEALAFVKALNETWTKGEAHRLGDYFHPDMVAITATDRDILHGRDVCSAAWRKFAEATTIHYWKELETKVRIFGNTAIVTYYFDMSFDMRGRTIQLGGRDMYVLVKEDGRWWAVADQFSGFPAD